MGRLGRRGREECACHAASSRRQSRYIIERERDMSKWALIAIVVTPAGALAVDRTPAPLPAEKAAKTSVLPDGFAMTVFAAEPDVVQPISFTIDARGRLWV